jgi:hypothetical protein
MSAHSTVIATARTQMCQCSHASDHQVRVSRKWFQRIAYSEVYFCTACGASLGIHHRYISTLIVNNFRFIFSRYSHCVSCGSGAVDRGGRLYFPSINPLAWIQVLAAAPLRECSPCGRQFFDWRPARPLPSDTASASKMALDLAALHRAIPQSISGPAPERGVQESEQPLHTAKEP